MLLVLVDFVKTIHDDGRDALGIGMFAQDTPPLNVASVPDCSLVHFL